MRSRSSLAILALITLALTCSSFAGDPLKNERGQMKMMLKSVATEIEKNFYDPAFKGADLRAAADLARNQIDSAQNVNDMLQAIYDFTQVLHDSHTYFIPPRPTLEPKYGFRLKAFGDEVRVYDVDKDGAAEKAGLKLGDRVASINDELAARDNVAQLTVKHWLLRPLNPMMVMLKLGPGDYRQVDVLPHIKKRPAVLDTWNRYGDLWNYVTDAQTEIQKYYTHSTGKKGDVGYINLRWFMESEDFVSGIVEKVSGSKALVIDFRDNPGGAEDTVIAFCGLFEASETPIGKFSTRKETKPKVIKPRKPYTDVPIVLLVDADSASAAEIATRYLQKKHNAIVIGDKTAGYVNGSRVFDSRVGLGVVVDFATSISVERVELDGETLEGSGVKPDIQCIPTSEDMRNKVDTCLAVALKTAEAAIAHKAKIEAASK